MDSLSPPTLFTRHNRPLHALWLESQAWFCAHELGRLSGHFFDEQSMRKLDPDQYRAVQLLRYGKCQMRWWRCCVMGRRTGWRMRDMPVVLAAELASVERRKLSWRECAQRAMRMHGV
ncbi:hypothetical protein D9M71_512580 [compost metagenome]